MKKIFILSLVTILCLSVFVGCTPSSEQTTNTTEQSQADISKEDNSDIDRAEPESEDVDQSQSEPELEEEAQSPDKNKDQTEPKDTAEKKQTDEEKKEKEFGPAELSIDEYVQHLVSSTLGDTTSQGNEVLLKYDYSNEELVLNLAADGDESYTVDVIQEKLFAASNKLFSKVFADRQDIDNFTLVWYLYLVDKKDGEQGGKACTIEMSRDTFESINWDEVTRKEFPDKVDDFWIHPALTE